MPHRLQRQAQHEQGQQHVVEARPAEGEARDQEEQHRLERAQAAVMEVRRKPLHDEALLSGAALGLEGIQVEAEAVRRRQDGEHREHPHEGQPLHAHPVLYV